MDDMDDMDGETEGKEIHEDTKSLVSIGSFCMFWVCICSSSKCFRFDLLGLLHLHHLHNCFSCQLCDQAQVLSSILLHLHWMVPELCPHCSLRLLSVGFLYILWQWLHLKMVHIICTLFLHKFLYIRTAEGKSLGKYCLFAVTILCFLFYLLFFS